MRHLVRSLPILLLALLVSTPPASARGRPDPLTLVEVGVEIAEGESGIQRAGGYLVWQRYANMRRGQTLSFWATFVGAEGVVRVLGPDGKAQFDAAPQIPDGTDAASKTYEYGFDFKAPRRARYMIQFLVKVGSRAVVRSQGRLTTPKAPTVPGTWSVDYESLAFEFLNLNGQSMENLPQLAQALAQKFRAELVFRADGTFHALMVSAGKRKTQEGRWSLRGSVLSMTTTTDDGQPVDADEQKTDHVQIEDGQIVIPRGMGGSPVPILFDKIAD